MAMTSEAPSQTSHTSIGTRAFTPLPWIFLGVSLLFSGGMTLWARKSQRDVDEKRESMADALAAAATHAERLQVAQKQQKAMEEQITLLQSERKQFEGQLKTLNEEIQLLEAEGPQLRATFDFLSKALQADIRSKQMKVDLGKGRVQVALSEGVFDDTQLSLTPAGNALLLRLGSALKRIDATQAIQVSAHTDEAGIPPALADRFPTPWEFTATQAAMVAKHLVEKSQVPGQQISAAGYAQFHPVTSNATPDPILRHRRVEILLAPAHLKPSTETKTDVRPNKSKKRHR